MFALGPSGPTCCPMTGRFIAHSIEDASHPPCRSRSLFQLVDGMQNDKNPCIEWLATFFRCMGYTWMRVWIAMTNEKVAVRCHICHGIIDFEGQFE
ncbi:hypothetical protein TNIN_146421 [Trichonephila inaurata madagascariensis]|uniref:Uncharacterized protein n=1 Tax=Trichonephila inaurata madagascariensis TaxID=2747483 RepID=A0A8X7C5U2_9ARAC|nr:hypothetical protein TNIN_146421 [Trichonephila inaurata madagascariensis]